MAVNSSDEARALLVERINERLAALKISGTEASRRAGFSLSYTNDILKGRSQQPEASKLRRLADVLECDLDYLLGEQAMPRQKGRLARLADIPALTHKLIPLYGPAKFSAGQWFEISSEPVDEVPALPAIQNVPGAYAVTVPNERMAPRYLTGEVIYVHPAAVARPGDFVFVRMNNGLSGIARLGAAGESVELSTLNPDETVSHKLTDIDTIHRIVGSAG